MDDERRKRLALIRFEKVSVALIIAFTNGDEKAAKSAYGQVMIPPMRRAHNAVLRGDEEPTGEASKPLAPNFELKAKINREGPTLFLQTQGYDR